MKILLYTHSDYSWVWKYWHQQTDKFLSNYDKICFLNSESNFRDDYRTIKYDDNDSYKDRIYSCLEKLDNDLIVLFCHEDMFLYNKPNFTTLNEYINLIKENKCDTIKLIKAFENLEESKLHNKLFKNPDNQLFSIQPTILKVKTLKYIYNTVPGNNIWEFEGNTNRKYLNDLISLCSFDEKLDIKRGKYHYDSSVFPYICTAVIKGKWNFKEYKKELYEIFYKKKYNVFSYYLSKIKF